MFFQAEDGIRDLVRSRGLGDVYKRQGWVCVSINYRLSPRATFPDHLIDVKRALAWVQALSLIHI